MPTERVAICTAIEDRSPLGQVVPRWAEIDFGGADVVVSAACYDAGNPTRERFGRSVPWPVYFLPCADLPALVPNLEVASRPYDFGTEVVRSHKRAALRTAVKDAALCLEADWLLWLDSDNTIPPDGFRLLRDTLESTIGPLAPRTVGAPYAARRTGQILPALWGERHLGECSVYLRPGAVVAAGYQGFGSLLMRREVAEHPALDFLSMYTHWRNRRRTRMELDWEQVLKGHVCGGVYGEDALWFKHAEQAYGVPTYCDCRVLSEHWRDEHSRWQLVFDGPDGDDCTARLVMDDGRVFDRGDPAIPEPQVDEPAEPVQLQEAAG